MATDEIDWAQLLHEILEPEPEPEPNQYQNWFQNEDMTWALRHPEYEDFRLDESNVQQENQLDDEHIAWMNHVILNLLPNYKPDPLPHLSSIRKTISQPEFSEKEIHVPRSFAPGLARVGRLRIILEHGSEKPVKVQGIDKVDFEQCNEGEQLESWLLRWRTGYVIREGVSELFALYNVEVGDVVVMSRVTDRPHHFRVKVEKMHVD